MFRVLCLLVAFVAVTFGQPDGTEPPEPGIPSDRELPEPPGDPEEPVDTEDAGSGEEGPEEPRGPPRLVPGDEEGTPKTPEPRTPSFGRREPGIHPVPSLQAPTKAPDAEPSSYFILAPRTVRPGMSLEMTVMITNATSDVTISAEVNGREYNRGKTRLELITSSTETFSPGQKGIMYVELPESLPSHLYSFGLVVTGSGGLAFKHDETLYLRRKSISIFIQTDKSQYKPGQTVRMRVFAVDHNLKPYHGDLEIKIQDKARNIIKHWKNQRSDSGVVQKELVLSDQPVMGEWSIEATAMGQSVRKSFDVKEYVLPKVEVEVDVDEYMDEDQEFMNGTIRAKYTYGKPVSGPVNVTVLRYYPPYYRQRETPKTLNIMTQLKDGKADFSVRLETLKKLIERPYYYREEYEWEPSLTWQTFTVNATVRDELTDISYQNKKQVNFRRSIYSIQIVHAPSNYKLGSRYFAMVQIKNMNGGTLTEKDLYTDGEPEPLRVTTRYRDCYKYNGEYQHVTSQNLTLEQDGFLRFEVEIMEGCEGFQLEIWFRDTNSYSSYASMFRTRYKTGALTLSLDDLRQQIMPGDQVAVNVQFADSPKEYTYYIMSKGAVVEWKTLPASENRFTFLATTHMAPSAKIVAWYTTEKYEIISDSLSINLGDIFENKVSLSFSTNKTQPASQLSLDVSAAPQSYVALLAVDKSVLLLEDTHDITKQAVEGEMRQYETGSPFFPSYFNFARCWWPIPIGGGDPMSIFRNADVLVMTDGYIYEYDYGQEYYRGRAERGEGGSPGAQARFVSDGSGAPAANLQKPDRVRSVFPETWIWADRVTDADGKTTLQVTAPDTITSWVASAFALHDEKGLGVAAHRSKMTVFKPFFVSLNLPYSVIRNEEFALQVLVYNYMETEQQALVTLEQSMEFSVRKGGKNLAQEQPKNQQLTEWITIPAGEAKSVYFWIVPNILGNIKIQAMAQTSMAADAVRRTLLVEPEGVEKEFTNSYFIDMSGSDSNIYTRQLEINFPENTIDGSERVSITVVGDVLSQSMSGLDRLIKMPYGCGEQNMVTFVPNIVALRYLNVTGQENEKIRKQAIFYMDTGYQRELTYKHSDGSYSAFGERDESGSLWLTAFVLKSFLQAKDYIYIDDNTIAEATRWIIRSQNTSRGPEKGSFIEPGRVLSSYMQGGSGKGAAMTAYTLIALSQDNLKVPEQEPQLEHAKQLAVEYLEGQLLSQRDKPYTLAIITYALKLAGSERADEAFLLFNNLAVENANEGMRYWQTKQEEDANKPYWYYWYQAKASDIELNAYAMLIYLQRGMVADSLPIAKWLLAQRNSYGGFSSTQDTVIGLEALGELAAQLSTASQQNVQLSLQSTQVVYYFQPITKKNNLILQRAEFPGKVTDITVHGQGRGVAIMQVAVQYNVEEDEMKPLVDMSVDARSMKDYLHLNVCSSWKSDEDSGMMVTEVQMLTGYGQQETNAEILNRLKEKGVKRVENKEKNLVFYFDELTNKPICVDLITKKFESVNNIKKAKIATYQYYSPDEQTIVMYSLSEEDADQDACSVCPACCASNQTARYVPVESTEPDEGTKKEPEEEPEDTNDIGKESGTLVVLKPLKGARHLPLKNPHDSAQSTVVSFTSLALMTLLACFLY